MEQEDVSKVVYVDVEKLQFDLRNPRFPALNDQRDALHAFCDDDHAKKTVLLAEDIAEKGLNPSELLIVTRGSRRGQYNVLEGNRRLAAMKLLAIPARLADSPLSKPFQARLRKATQLIDQTLLRKVPCRLLANREEANVWIALKHTGENEGVGVVSWNGTEASRFRGDEAALRLLDYVKAHADLSELAKKGLKRFPVTNLDRLLGDPDVRRALGLTLDRGVLALTHPAEQVIRGLTRVIEDISKRNVTVTAIKLKQDRADYINSIAESLPTGPALDTPIDLSGTPQTPPANQSSALAATPSPKIRNTVSTRARRSIIAKSSVIPISLPKVVEIFNELRTLDADTYPNAASALLRAFVDITTLEYFEKFKLSANGQSSQVELKPRISAVLDDYKSRSGSREACNTARSSLLQTTGVIYVDSLNLNLHGRYAHPIPDHLRLGWDMIEPWMRGLWITLEGLASASNKP